MLINGQMKHVANMIAAAEGQYLNGIKLTADDVIAIGTPSYDDKGNDLLPGNNSIFKGYSMHDVQAGALESEYRIEKLDEKCNELGITIQDAWDKDNLIEYTDYVGNALNRLVEDAKKLADVSNQTINWSKSQMIDTINGMSDGFDVLADIYNDIQDGEDFDFTKLDTKKFEEAFKGLEDEYTEFIETVSDSPSDIKACQDAFDKLAGAYINNSGVLENLTDENANVTAAMLKNMGIANAEAIVLEQLALNKEKAKEETQKLAEAGIEEAASHIDLADGISIEEKALAQLAITKMFVNGQTIQTSADINNIIALAQAAGIAVEELGELANIKKIFDAVNSGSAQGQAWLFDGTFEKAQSDLAKYNNPNYWKDKFANVYDYKSPKTPSGSGGSDKDPYLEAFEKELKKLEELRDSGLISEKEYLDKLRDLYIKYFKDREKYIDEFKKYEQQYLQGMYDLYNSAIGAATSILSRQMNDLSDQRDKEIKQIEKEQEAAEKAIQSQIDKKQEEIDKIQEAREERQRDIDLQKAQYNLERLQNQKTRLVYKDGHMVYETDSSAIFDAREEVRNAKEDIKIAKLEKEIDSLEDKLEEVTEYYENLKKSTNEYYDSMVDGMQSMIDKWEELSEMMEFAENIEILKSLGISVEDVLSGNTAVFEQFKNDYIGITGALNNENEAFLSSLAEASGKTVDEILALSKSFKDFSSGVSDSLNGLGNSADDINVVKDAVKELGDTSSTASESVGKVSDSTKDIASNTTEIENRVSEIQSSINGIDAEKINTLKTYFGELSTTLGAISNTLNGTDGTGGIISGLANIVTPETLIGLINLVGQFNTLKSAVDAVSSAISGGSSSSDSKANEGGGLATGANGGAATPDMSGGSTGSLKSALKEQVEEAKTIIPEEIALFNGEEESLLSGVNDVIGVLTGGKDSSGEGENVDPSTLIGANQLQYEKAAEIIPEEINLFEELAASIAACVAQLLTMVSLLESASGFPNAPGTPGGSGGDNGWSGGGASGGTGLNGNANVTGTWGAKSSAKTLVGELGQELVVRGNKFFTVGDNGAEFVDIKKDDIVFNHKQTEELLKNGHVTGRGKALAGGNYVPLSPANSDKFSMFSKLENFSKGLMLGSNNLNYFNDALISSTNGINNIKSIPNTQEVNINIGDINLTGVQDVNGLANAITTKLPNVLLQTITKR